MSPATIELRIQLQVLLVYAHHWLGLLRQVAERGFSLLAQCFGSIQPSFVLSNLTRGILRAIALERVLQARADGEPEPVAGTSHRRASTEARQSAMRQSRASHDRSSALPTLRQLEAAIRRRPVDGVIDDIRRDLGLCFSLCEARFGNALRDMVTAYRDTLSNLLNEFPRREAITANAPECDSAFALPPQKPDAIRYIVGCFGAQQPVCGFPFTASPIGGAITGAQPP